MATSWGTGGGKSRALNAVSTAITGALGGQGGLQVAANTLAPYAAETIGRSFGHNGSTPSKTAQLFSHAVLGATLAYINGGKATSGAVAGAGSEAAAIYLTQTLYKDQATDPATGKLDPDRLPEKDKEHIRDLTAAIGAVAGGIAGDSAVNAQIAGVVGRNAVENNLLNPKFDGKGNNDRYNRFAKLYIKEKAAGKTNSLTVSADQDIAKNLKAAQNCVMQNNCSTLARQLHEWSQFYVALSEEYAKSVQVNEAKKAQDLAYRAAEAGQIAQNNVSEMWRLAAKRSSGTPSNAKFIGPNKRIWNDGRFSAGLDATLPDYVALQAGPGTLYIPLYGSSSDAYVGG